MKVSMKNKVSFIGMLGKVVILMKCKKAEKFLLHYVKIMIFITCQSIMIVMMNLIKIDYNFFLRIRIAVKLLLILKYFLFIQPS